MLFCVYHSRAEEKGRFLVVYGQDNVPGNYIEELNLIQN